MFLLITSGAQAQVTVSSPSATPTHGAEPDKRKDQLSADFAASYSHLPLSFEANEGQTDGRVQFLSRTPAYSLFLQPDAATLSFNKAVEKRTAASRERVSPQSQTSVLRMRLLGASTTAKGHGDDLLPGKTSYLLGNDPAHWQAGLANLSKSEVHQTLMVSALTPTIALTVPASANVGSSVTLTVALTGSGVTPTGTVKFLDGTTLLNSSPLTGGKASFSTATLAVGAHSITAQYSGDSNYSAGASTASTLTIDALPATVALTVSPTSGSFGASITLSATVSSTTGTPTGTVNFLDGMTVLNTAMLVQGKAAYATKTEGLERESEASDLWIGRTLGPFQLQRMLGRGGMGVVYLARRVSGGFTQTVAVKLIARHLVSTAALDQFARERDALARLQHRNIAGSIDAGVTPEGTPYIAMDFVEGRRLDEVFDDRHVPLEQKLGLILQLCDAVSYVHRNLMLHRDLKPGNVLVTANDVLKLLDFGTLKRLLGRHGPLSAACGSTARSSWGRLRNSARR